MSEVHATLAPSAANQWYYCAGSILMQDSVPPLEEDTEASREGDAVHWVAAEVLQNSGCGGPSRLMGVTEIGRAHV